MYSAAPELAPRGVERGLIGTILISALLHAAAIGLLIAVPGRFLSVPPRIQSYTVDLVAPDVIGGTNLVPGGGARKPVPAKVEPEAAEPASETVPPAPAPAAAPPPAAEQPAPPPKVAEPVKPVEPPKPVEAPKPPPPVAAQPPKPPPPKAVEAKPAEAKPPPKPAEAKPPEPPKPAEAVKPKPAAEAKPVAKPPPPPAPAKAVAPEKPPVAQKAAPEKPAEAAAKPPAKPAAKPEVKPEAKAETKPKADAPAKAVAAAPPTPVAKAKAVDAAQQRDQAINAAVQKRAAEASQRDAAAKATDERIAAAVQKRAQQLEKGGSGAPGAGGPIVAGPANGVGGTPTDLQYVLYEGRMRERIKNAWAWTGADRSLTVIVQFNIAADGQIRNVRTIQSSGDASYDASAERAVRAVNPLEPVPEKYRDAFATVELTFRASDLES